MRRLIKKIGELCFVAALIPLKLAKHFVTVRTFLGNQTLFGHLALEPEKYLCGKQLSSQLNEIGFHGPKTPENIGVLNCIQPETKIVIDLWTFGSRLSQSNAALVKMWKRQLRVIPSQVVDLMLKANDRFSRPPIIDYRFSTLLSAEKYLDCCEQHLEFSSKEIDEGLTLLKNLGIPSGTQYVCVVTREGGDEESFLRNKDINDLSEMIDAFVGRGIAVVRLGGPNSLPLKNSGGMIFDYAHSEYKSPESDIYLIANCHFMVSTMTGPDALALAFRKNVLLLDIAHYGLLFSGTKLITWVPSILHDGEKNLSVSEVFNSGAGWFWKDSQFRKNGISVSKSSPTQIAEYGIELLDRLNSEQVFLPSELQNQSQAALQNAMGDLGESWHGEVKALIPNSFLEQNKNWFLS
jgi:putative glycosyltransferase (TIGR04372 family)